MPPQPTGPSCTPSTWPACTPVALWLGFFLFYNAIHLASWASIRYRLPTDAVMLIFAGLALTRVGEWILSVMADHDC